MLASDWLDQGYVSLAVSLDLDTHVRVNILTDLSLRESCGATELLSSGAKLKVMNVAKNIR